jgi:secreted trypsin-like serine protease
MFAKRSLAAVIGFVAAILVIATSGGTASAIVGGSNVTGQMSFVVSIQTPDYPHYCTGSLISPRVVLTAYHCVEDGGKLNDITGWRARIGSTDRTRGGKLVAFAGRPVRVGSTDMAVLRLATPVRNTPVRLASAPAISHLRVTATGWGQTCLTGQTGCRYNPPVHLRQVSGVVPIAAACHPMAPVTHPLCVWFDGNRGTSHGDSGGPALIRDKDGTWRQIGVLFGGASHARGVMATYTPLAGHSCEINSAAWKLFGRNVRCHTGRVAAVAVASRR